MKYFKIPNTDLNISELILGTWVFGADNWGGANPRDCAEAIAAALERGVNCIDLAPIYGFGLAETVVGRALRQYDRSKIILSTKCGLVRKDKTIQHDLRPVSIRAEIERSLKRLQVDWIDLYQLHWPDPNTPIEQTMLEMIKLQKEGKIRFIGVSNFSAEQINAAQLVCPVASVQAQYSLLDRTCEDELLSFCRQNEVSLLAYGVLGGGILSGKYVETPKFKGGDARRMFYHFYQGDTFSAIHKSLDQCRDYGYPLNQIALNWVRSHPDISATLVGCRNAQQAHANFDSLNWDMTPDMRANIGALFNL